MTADRTSRPMTILEASATLLLSLIGVFGWALLGLPVGLHGLAGLATVSALAIVPTLVLDGREVAASLICSAALTLGMLLVPLTGTVQPLLYLVLLTAGSYVITALLLRALRDESTNVTTEIATLAADSGAFADSRNPRRVDRPSAAGK